ncbi:MAG: type III secretion system inner membrane ring subunit SctD [Verrucomicrobiota bacterium]
MTDPFPDMGDVPECFLRILSGVHASASVPLSQGDYEIGSGMKADFIIADNEMAECHALLAVTQGNVKLRHLEADAPIYLDGVLATGEAFPLAPEQVFTLGATHFTLTVKGDSDTSRLNLPSVRPVVDEDDKVEPDDGLTIEEEDSSFLDEVKAPEPLESEVHRGSAGKWWWWTLPLLLLLIALAIWAMGSADEAGGEEPSAASLKEQLDEVLKRYPAEKGIRITKDEVTGAVTASGLATSADAKATISRDIREIAPRARLKISSFPTVENSVRSVLDQMGGEYVSADLSLEGRLDLSGEVSDNDTIPKLVARLSVDLPVLSEVDVDGVWTRESLIEKLNAFTEQFGLQDFLSYALEDSSLVVGGTLPPNEISAFEKLKENLKSEFEPGLMLDDRVRILNEMPVSVRTVSEVGEPAVEPQPKPIIGPSELPLSEKAGISGFRNVTVGLISWVVTSDGVKLLEGATLPSGFTIEKITRDYVQLRKQDIIETIYLK